MSFYDSYKSFNVVELPKQFYLKFLSDALNGKRLVITEGEIDCMSVAQMDSLYY